MADRRSRSRVTGQRIVELVGDHRANDFIAGHPGRLSYIPLDNLADQADIGDLYSNRNPDTAPVLQEVTAAAEWFPPTGTSSDIPSAVPARERRPQRNWLLRNQPEALLGTLGLGPTGAAELVAQHAYHDETRNLPLLTMGEISDATDPSRPTGQPALAMAAGQSGHVLRVVRLQPESWQWDDSDSVHLQLASAEASEEGHLCGDSVPYHQLKFVSSRKRYDPTRWLIAQKSTKTVILRPELQRAPVPCNNVACQLPSNDLPYISMNPVITLSGEKTGGAAHCDVSFNPGTDQDPPQLAIIDECGNWTVWDIMDTKSAGHRTIYPLRRCCGQFVSGFVDSPPLYGSGDGELHRLLWVSHARQAGTRPSGQPLSPTSSPKGTPDQGWSISDPSRARCEKLLLCNRTSVKLFSLNTGRFQRTVSMARHNKTDQILDVQICPSTPSQVFVLTTTSFYWLDVSAIPEKEDSKKTKFDPNNTATHRHMVLISCPHLRDQSDKSLKIVSLPENKPGVDGSCAVWIYSERDTLVTVLWLKPPGDRRQAQLQHLLLRLANPMHSMQRDIAFMAVSLASNTAVAPAGYRFFQIVTLGADFDLSCSLYVFKTGQDRHTRVEDPPRRYRPVPRVSRRAKALSQFGDAFVVSDDFDERKLFAPVKVKEERGATDFPARRILPAITTDFSRVVHLLSERVKLAVDNVEQPTGDLLEDGPLSMLRQHLAGPFADRDFPLQTLLELSGDFVVDFEADVVGARCTTQLERLAHESEETLQVVHLSRGGRDMSGSSIFGTLSHLWSASMQEDTLDQQAVRRRQSLLAHIATLLFLSQTGVAKVSTKHPTNDTPASQTSAPDLMDISSSPPGRLPTPVETASSRAASFESDADKDSETNPSQDGDDGEDPAVARLRKYAVAIKTVPPRSGGPSRLLSHWPEEPGSDPGAYIWMLDDAARNNVREQVLAKQGRDEARRRRRAEKLGLQRHGADEDGVAATQPLPVIQRSSQVQAWSSQAQSQGLGGAFESQSSSMPVPVQTMSQPLGGVHGARPKPKKGKGKGRGRKVGGFK